MAGAWKGLRPGFPSGLQVLVIDGAELQDQLKELGYAATMFATAREAAVSLSRGQSTPDVLLAEARSVHPGEADSQWLLAQARARHLPLVLMSEGGGPGEVMKGIELGAVDYLEKPVSLPKLRNIWQHVVRKMMASNVDEKPMSYSVPKAQPQPVANPAVGKAASGTDAPALPSPAISVDCAGGGALSGITSHSSKCSEAEASSCSENTKSRRVLRSADTCAESSGKASPSDGSSDGSAATAVPPKPLKLSRASSSSAPSRSRGKRSAPARSKSDAAANAAAGPAPQQQQQPAAGTASVVVPGASLAAVSYPASVGMPVAAGWQPGCVWGAPMVPMGWQQVGMPASFMPVDSSTMATTSLSDGAATLTGKGAAAASHSPVSLPSIASFASAMSCSTELDLPFPSTGDLSAMNVGAVSPSFGSSDNSLHSDFTDLMLPNDLDLDLMFGDGMDGLFGGDVMAAEPVPTDKPPIGLALRKSQSLVDLINAQLGAQQSTKPAAAMAKAAATGITPMQCA